MTKEPNKKLLARLGIIYGIIIAFINYIGFLLPSSANMPVQNTENMQMWNEYLTINSSLSTIFSIITFVIPSSICILYCSICKKENVERRIINIPVMFAIIGSMGWLIAFIMEFAVLLYLKISTGLSIQSIVLSSFLNITQECMLISTLGYLCLDAVHRKFILPVYFPEGNLKQYKGTIKLSTKLLFIIFYISVCVFPCFYLISTLYVASQNYNFTIAKNTFIVFGVIFTITVIILITFSKYFSNPLQKLIEATNFIKTADYNHKIDIVSCDDFGELSDTFNDMTLSLDSKTKKILAIQDSIIKGMAVMVESRDNSTGGHINRTSDCVRIFIKNLKTKENFANLSESFCNSIIKAAPMHDLGKIAVDDAVLRKPGKFTDEEYEKMKKHSAEGARIVENVLKEVDDLEFKKIAVNVAHYHHEKWNGTGYPEKLTGENIPLEARIMALADVFDALVSKRCYKDSMSYDSAFKIIEESLGSHFDPVLGKEFIDCKDELVELYSQY